MRPVSTLFRLFLTALLLPVQAFAQGPALINYQGRLSDSAGAAITGTRSVTFRIFDAATLGTKLWEETQPSVAVTNGAFAVQLGAASAVSPSLFDGTNAYLEIQVGSEVLTPRRRLVSVPYALSADRLGGKDASAYLVQDASGNVGIGTSAPAASLDIKKTGATIFLRNDGGAANDSPSIKWNAPGSANGLQFYSNGNLLGQMQDNKMFVAGGHSTFAGLNMADLYLQRGGGGPKLSFGEDTASAPAFLLDSVLSFSNAALLDVRNGGASKFTVTAGGRLGIGTTSPEAVVHIQDPAAGGQLLYIKSPNLANGVDGAGIIFGRSGNTGEAGNLFFVGSATPGQEHISLGINNKGNLFVVKGSGSVGIGSVSPAYKLDVNGQANASQLCIAGDCKSAWSAVASPSQWTTAGTTITYNAGGVGIGAAAAKDRLEVSGSVLLSTGTPLRFWGPAGGDRLEMSYDGPNNQFNISTFQDNDIPRGGITISNPQSALSDIRFYTGTSRNERLRLHSSGGASLGGAYVGIDPGANNMIIQGNLGIQYNTTPPSPLSVAGSFTNSTNLNGTIYVPTSQSVGTTGSYHNRGMMVNANPLISAGVTNSGSLSGIYSLAYRLSASDQGTLSTLRSLYVQYGHGGVAASAVTDKAYGLYIDPLHNSGTINNSYGIFISNPSQTGGTVGSYWAIYQQDASAPNYFAGNVGIGSAAPGQKLDVVGGSVRSDTGFCIGASCITSWPSGGTSQWTTTGSNIYYSAGNVGIGTTSPASNLTINGPTPTTAIIDTVSGTGLSLRADNGFGTLGTWTNNPFTFFVNNVERMRLDTAGNVGIGTTSNAAGFKLEVSNAGGTGLRVADSTNLSSARLEAANDIGTITAAKNGAVPTTLKLRTQLATGNLNDTMVISAGNVGIGTTNPGAKLEVAGDIKVPTQTVWCTYGSNPGNQTCSCPSGYFALSCGTNHYSPGTNQVNGAGTGCYSEQLGGTSDSVSAIVVVCSKIHN